MSNNTITTPKEHTELPEISEELLKRDMNFSDIELIEETTKSLYLHKVFYGYVLMNIRKVPTFKIPIAAVDLKQNLLFNPERFKLFDKEGRMAILEHEVLHLGLLHIPRFYSQIIDIEFSELANIAMDAAVNQLIDYKMPIKCVTLDTIKNLTSRTDIKALESAEYYFKALLEKKKEVEDKIKKESKCQKCGGSGESKDPCDKCGGSGKNADGTECEKCNGSGKKPCDKCGGDGLSEFGKMLKDIKDGHSQTMQGSQTEGGNLDPVSESAMRNILQSARNRQYNADIERGRGTLPGDSICNLLPTYVTLARNVWKTVANKCMGFTPKADSYQVYNRPNRRHTNSHWGSRHILEATKMYIIIDVSGSVIDAKVAAFLGHINRGLKANDLRATILQIDAHITKINENVSSLSMNKEVVITGRGGTTLTTGLDYIEEKEKNNKVNLLVMTDGATPWRECKNIAVSAIYTKNHTPLPGVKNFAVIEL